MPNAKVLSEKQAIVADLTHKLQNAAAGVLALYGLLRLLLCPQTALGCYAGPLALLWPLAWLLLLVSFTADAWLCRREQTP